MKHSHKFLHQGQQGSILVLAMVGIGLVGLLASIASQAGAGYIQEALQIKASHQVKDVERAIRVKTNCTQTIRLVQQGGHSQQATLVDQTSRPIDSHNNSQSGMKFGGWNIFFRGIDRNGKLIIEAENLNLGATAIEIFTDTPLVCR